MKNKLILIIVLLVALIIIGVIFKDPKTKVGEKINPSSLGELVMADSFETKVLARNDDYVKFDVKYPYFKNINNDFNLKIEDLVKSQMDNHENASRDNWQARFDTQTKGDNIEKVPTDEEKFSFFSDFEIIQSNSSYISFVLKYGGFSGGAHGYENYVSFNYDIKNQKLIELKDLFHNNPQYLNYLSEKSREYLKGEFATVSEEDKQNSSPEAIQEYVDNIISMIEAGTEPTEENFSVFTFTDDKVKIYFAQYQVGPYTIGMPEVELDRN